MLEVIDKCQSWARDIRKIILELSYGVGKKGVHIGSALSVADILAVLYGGVLKYNPDNGEDVNRDYFILSKGHAYVALYASLCKAGFFGFDELKSNFMTDDGFAPVHPVKDVSRGIEFSGGSLGTGVSFAVGKAYSLKLKGKSNRVFTLLGDGECNEGSVWEALMSASHLKLDNLAVIVDMNGLQQDGPTSEVLSIDIARMSESVGFYVREVNGNDVEAVYNVLSDFTQYGKPTMVVAHTVKGSGVSFMENNNSWHHAFLNEKQYLQAMEELKKM